MNRRESGLPDRREDFEETDLEKKLEKEEERTELQEALSEIESEQGVFDEDLVAKMLADIEGIEDPEGKERLTHILIRVINLQQEIDLGRHEAVGSVRAAALTEAGEEFAEGSGQLERFVESFKQPHNLFYIDKNLSTDQLRARLLELNDLYLLFRSSSSEDQNRMERIVSQMFGIKQMPEAVAQHLDEIDKLEATEITEGAENRNSIFLDNNLRRRVIKRTKERHDTDFTSVIKLMRDMHILSLHFNQEQPEGEHAATNLVFEDMAIYLDADGNYKRMVRQDFAPGISIKALQPDEWRHGEFRDAWQEFLSHVEKMKEEYGAVLDITDSEAGFRRERGNVANTGNIFVEFPKEEGDRYKFYVIDPDVFDVRGGEHKFFPSEYVRKKGSLRGLLDAAKMAMTNTARDRLVRQWQDEYVKKELKNDK